MRRGSQRERGAGQKDGKARRCGDACDSLFLGLDGDDGEGLPCEVGVDRLYHHRTLAADPDILPEEDYLACTVVAVDNADPGLELMALGVGHGLRIWLAAGLPWDRLDGRAAVAALAPRSVSEDKLYVPAQRPALAKIQA